MEFWPFRRGPTTPGLGDEHDHHGYKPLALPKNQQQKPLKMDGWNTTYYFPIGFRPIFRCKLAGFVSGYGLPSHGMILQVPPPPLRRRSG